MKPPAVIGCEDRLVGESTCCVSMKTRVKIQEMTICRPSAEGDGRNRWIARTVNLILGSVRDPVLSE